MDITFKCPGCGKEHILSNKEFNKLMETDKCSYKCNCGKINKIVQNDTGFYIKIIQTLIELK